MIYIKIPASSANFGPAFDCMGISLQIYNEFLFERTSNAEAALQVNDASLVHRSMQHFYKLMGASTNLQNIKITINSDIPIAKGLGSSATCVLAGVLAANKLSGANISEENLLTIAAEIEGHVDNVAPALFGGVIVATKGCWHNQEKASYIKIDIKPLVDKGVKFGVITPEYDLQTNIMRNILPNCYSREDVVFNIAHTSLLIAALTAGDIAVLKRALKDRIHQPYRSKQIQCFDEIMEIIEKNNAIGAFLSGSGPTIFVIYECGHFQNKIEEELAFLPGKWNFSNVLPDLQGALIEFR